MKLYKLDKTVLSVKNNAEKFLNGITANSLEAPQNAFVNIHGRIIATFDQLKVGDDEYWLAIDAPYVKDVLAHVDRYARLSQTAIVQKDLEVFFDLNGEFSLNPDERAIPQKSGRLILTKPGVRKGNISDEELTLFRINHHIPMMGVDFKQDEFLLNVSEIDFVSFTKGCFLGQEPISKVHNRAKPTWKLVVKFEDESSAEKKAKMPSKVRDSQSGRMKGFVFVKN